MNAITASEVRPRKGKRAVLILASEWGYLSSMQNIATSMENVRCNRINA